MNERTKLNKEEQILLNIQSTVMAIPGLNTHTLRIGQHLFWCFSGRVRTTTSTWPWRRGAAARCSTLTCQPSSPAAARWQRRRHHPAPAPSWRSKRSRGRVGRAQGETERTWRPACPHWVWRWVWVSGSHVLLVLIATQPFHPGQRVCVTGSDPKT